MGRKPIPQAPRLPNPFKSTREIKAPVPVRRTAALKPPKRACPNKECTDPKIEDGHCITCGTIIDDFNIVSEVQFGENSSGAAVPQGTYIGADQGTSRGVGIGARPGLGHDSRGKNVEDAKPVMQALSNQLLIPEHTIQNGLQILKLASQANFIQGRRMDMVAAVCLYSACRKASPCRVMLIDFADRIQVNVFKLGHTFKALHKAVTISKEGIQPILPEDLIYRFASKLDFGASTSRVAEDAIRMVKRMSRDWMVMGRRPSGVCGACLILAARMNNFRRTVTEVVYIVKVTTHTIQKRLEEFKLTPTSELTVEEFLNNEFLEKAHDPPSFYEKQEDFMKNKKTRKRKRKTMQLGDDEADAANAADAADDDEPDKRQRAESNPDTPVPSVELQKDADGFVIPPRPTDIPIDPQLIDEQTASTLEQLADQFEERAAAYDAESPPATTTAKLNRRGPDNRPIFVPPAWEEDELLLEGQITEVINDPNTREHSIAYARAKKRTDAYMKFLEAMKPEGTEPINMDTHIGHDEFAGDPEVENCLLSPADIAIREKIWVNDNRAWLRKQQVKATAKRNAANGPPKRTRNRQKVPRVGEGQVSPASTPGEAAEAMLQKRAWSSKINYDVMKDMLDASATKGLGSLATSRATSRAPSSVTGSTAGSRAGSVAPSVARSEIDDNESIAESDLRDDASVADDNWKKELGQQGIDDDYVGPPDLEDDDADEFGDGFGRDDDDGPGFGGTVAFEGGNIDDYDE